MRELTGGKYWGMRRLAASGGTMAMLATDQRPPIMAMIRERTGRAATFAEIAEAKRMLVAALGGSASAVLTDPVWGYAASFAALSPGRGLIVTLEDHEYEEGPGGRRSAVIEGWSAEKIRRLGTDAVKLLAWYRPDAAEEVIAHQRAFVAGVGEACRAADIPFVLELLTYPFARGRGAGAEYGSDAGRRAELVLGSIPPFGNDGVDLWKLECPVAAESLPDADGKGAASAQALFDGLAAVTPGPWVLLSGGADFARFRNALVYACRAGASGFLAGRSIWADAFRAWPERAEVGRALGEVARKRLEALAELAERMATPWHLHPRFGPGGPVLADEGEGFSRRYGAEMGAPAHMPA